MKTHEIEITETLQKTVSVEAKSPEEAYQKARASWKSSEYVLNADDFVGVDFGYATRQSEIQQPKKSAKRQNFER